MPRTLVRPPASDLVVRLARDDEYAAVGALTVAGYDADGYLVRPDGGYDHGYATWLADAATRGRDDVLLVATLGDELVGTVTWCPFGSASAQLARAAHQGEFRTLSIAPAARGRGVGRTLVEACLDRARTAGLTEVLLCSLTEMLPAHRLYTSLGFVRRPELDWSPETGVDLRAFSIDV
ncbi:MAG: GNAT family N-acetyltransferase [Aeromicrobium sp.]